MAAAIIDLCGELNLDPEDVLVSIGIKPRKTTRAKSQVCICKADPVEFKTECECGKTRVQPILCGQHKCVDTSTGEKKEHIKDSAVRPTSQGSSISPSSNQNKRIAAAAANLEYIIKDNAASPSLPSSNQSKRIATATNLEYIIKDSVAHPTSQASPSLPSSNQSKRVAAATNLEYIIKDSAAHPTSQASPSLPSSNQSKRVAAATNLEYIIKDSAAHPTSQASPSLPSSNQSKRTAAATNLEYIIKESTAHPASQASPSLPSSNQSKRKAPASNLAPEKHQSKKEITKKTIASDEVEIIHKTPNLKDSEQSFTDTALSESIHVQTHCMCGSPSCDPSTCMEYKVNEDLPLLLSEVSSETLEEEEKLDVIIEAVKEDESKSETAAAAAAAAAPVFFDTCAGLHEQCVSDKFKMYLEYFNNKMAHTKHVKELNASHYMTSIEPSKPQTTDLCVQTSNPYIPPVPIHPSPAINKMDKRVEHTQVSDSSLTSQSTDYKKSVETETQYNQEDFIRKVKKSPNDQPNITFNAMNSRQMDQSDPNFFILNGPIYIPKVSVKKSGEILNNSYNDTYNNHMFIDSTKSDQFTCGASSGFLSHLSTTTNNNNIMKNRVPRNFVPECCRPKEQWMIPCQEQNFQRNYVEYDLTPQKDTFLYENNNCQCTPNKNTNLLLSNRYNRYTAVTEHLSHFYPTIATQVSSMELLSYEKSTAVPVINIMHKAQNPASPLSKSIYSDTDDVKQSQPTVKVVLESLSTLDHLYQNTKEEDILNKLDRMPDVESTESMQQRIYNLKNDLERFKEGEEDMSGPHRSLQQEFGLRDSKGVSISHNVEVMQNNSVQSDQELIATTTTHSSQNEEVVPRGGKKNSFKYK